MRTNLNNRAGYGYNENFSSGNYNAFYFDLARKLEDLTYQMTFYDNIAFYKILILKYPAGLQYPDSNAPISQFIDKIMQYHHSRWRFPRQVWICERSMMGHHYHLVFLINSKKNPKRCNILKKANEIWQECLGLKGNHGLVHLITTSGLRCCSADFRLLEDKESFPSHFVRLIQEARFYAESGCR